MSEARYRPQSAFPVQTASWADLGKLVERPSTVAEGASRSSPVKLPRTVARMNRPQSTSGVLNHQRFLERRSTQLPAAADGSLMVEGCQTGQLVPTPEAPLRRPPSSSMTAPLRRPSLAASPPAAPGDGPAPAGASALAEAQLARERKEHQKDKQTIRRLEAEVKRLKELLAERDAEIAALNRQLVESDARSAAALEALRGECSALQTQLVASAAEREEMRARLKDLRDEGDTLRAAMETQRRAQTTREDELNRLVAELKERLRSLEHQASCATRVEQAALQRRQQDDRSREAAMQALRDELAQQAAKLLKLQHLETEVRAREAKAEGELTQLQERMQKFYGFIQKICQPQFSVVKDDSLTPINPTGFNVVEGHVLVPLVLLLEGYAFLPTTMRDTYNQSDYNPPTQQTVARKPFGHR